MKMLEKIQVLMRAFGGMWWWLQDIRDWARAVVNLGVLAKFQCPPGTLAHPSGRMVSQTSN